MGSTIDRFIPTAVVKERHEILVHAPAEFVFDVAERFPLQSLGMVRAIFWLRAKILGARYEPLRKGLIEQTLELGWSKLAYTPGREVVMGSVTQPWIADVKFHSIAPELIAAFREPGFVKIVWTLEAEPRGPSLTRLSTETRVQPTDKDAAEKFEAYWRKFKIGIKLIRRLGLAAVKKAAERRYEGLEFDA